MGALLWTKILASFCDIISNGDPEGLKFRQNLDELNLFIESHELPASMARRMREFVHAQRYCQMRLDTAKSLGILSPSLRVEVML